MSTLDRMVEAFESLGHDPERARGNCYQESFRFTLALGEVGIDAECVSGFSFTTMREELADMGVSPEDIESRHEQVDLDYPLIGQGHTAARVGDTVYDWTARQFPPHDQPVPLIQPYDEWSQTWRPLPVTTSA